MPAHFRSRTVGHAIRRRRAATQTLVEIFSCCLPLSFRCGVPEHGRRMDTLGKACVKKLNALSRKINLLQVQAGHTSAGPGKNFNVAKRHRIIIYCDHHNRYGRRRGGNGCHRRLVVREE